MRPAPQPPTTVAFRADADFDPPDLRPLVGRTERLPEQQVRRTYHDTADRRLWELGLVLCRHSGDGADRWALERVRPAPDADDVQGVPADEAVWAVTGDDLPPGAARVLAGVTRHEPLGPVAEVHGTRRRLVLRSDGVESPWAEIDDETMAVVGGRRDGHRYRRLTVRSVASPPAGSAEVLRRALKRMRSAGARPALGPEAEALLEPVRRADRRARRETLADAVRHALAGGLDRLLTHDLRLRAAFDAGAPFDARDVHQARVAARRLRSDLRTFAAVLDPVWLGHVTADLRWVGGALGRIRDLDVLASNLQGWAGQVDDDALSELLSLVSGQRARAAADLEQEMTGARYTALLDRLHAAVGAPPVTGDAAARRAADAVPGLVGRQWKDLERKVARVGRHPDDHDLHKVRIRSKRLRYAAEAAAAYDKRAAAAGTGAKRLQSVLGDVHDAWAARQWLAEQAAGGVLSPPAAFAAGRLSCLEEESGSRLRREWRRDWKVLRRRAARLA